MKMLEIGGYRDDKAEWPRIQNKMIDTMISFEKALREHIKNLPL
jgi:hypothetical protein